MLSVCFYVFYLRSALYAEFDIFFFYLFDTNAVISNIIYAVVSVSSPSLWSHLAVSVGQSV
jgi:hypothetical protein